MFRFIFIGFVIILILQKIKYSNAIVDDSKNVNETDIIKNMYGTGYLLLDMLNMITTNNTVTINNECFRDIGLLKAAIRQKKIWSIKGNNFIHQFIHTRNDKTLTKMVHHTILYTHKYYTHIIFLC